MFERDTPMDVKTSETTILRPNAWNNSYASEAMNHAPRRHNLPPA